MPYLRSQSIVAYAHEQAAETYPRGRAFVPHNTSVAGPSWSARARS